MSFHAHGPLVWQCFDLLFKKGANNISDEKLIEMLLTDNETREECDKRLYRARTMMNVWKLNENNVQRFRELRALLPHPPPSNSRASKATRATAGGR